MLSSSCFSRCSTTTTPSLPAFCAMDMMGIFTACFTISLPTFWSKFSSSMLSSLLEQYRSAEPPPGTIPSSTAAFVAFRASFSRSLTSCTSTSDAPPTLMTATPPESLARRSLSLSRSYSEVVLSIAAWICSQRARISSSPPAPSRMTVSSLVIVTVFAVPRACGSKVSSNLRPVSSLRSSAPQSTARSCIMALRWSPKPGAFTAATCRPPRSLLTTIVARASFSTSSATISNGRLALATCSRTGRMLCTVEIFLSKRRTRGSANWHLWALLSVMKYGEM
mmetsp:Transcript_91933/g.256108  ORF Transcript_91933/g.256108 Transcript_91933/m.256108 type:complete len:280 (+) Transcript_91933:206-1045(+)